MTQTYYLLVTPEQDELLAAVRGIAAQLLGTDASGWPDAVASEGSHWVSAQGVARLTMAEPSESTSGWIELQGFEGGGRARWILGEPPTLELEGLPDATVDVIWNTMRAQQAAALRAWVRARGVRPMRTGRPVAGFPSLFHVSGSGRRSSGLIPTELPRVTQPPFAPDDFPRWLFSGELSSLPRHVDALQARVAGIALEDSPERRLLVRAVHRAGSETIVPIVMMGAGHRPHGGAQSPRHWLNPTEVASALVEPIGRLAGGIKLDVPRFSADRDTEASPVYISRWGQLEQDDIHPFRLAGAALRVPRSSLALRMLEVRSAFAAPGQPDGLFELSIDGLEGGAQVHVVGQRELVPEAPTGKAWRARSFVIGPRERVEDLRLLIEHALH